MRYDFKEHKLTLRDLRGKGHGPKMLRMLAAAEGCIVPYVQLAAELGLSQRDEDWPNTMTNLSRVKHQINRNRWVRAFGYVEVKYGQGYYFKFWKTR